VTAAVIPLAPGITLGEAAAAFLGRRDLDPDTLRSYAQTMTRLRRELGDATPVSALTAQVVAAAASAAWPSAAARTWNRHRSAIRSFTAWAASPGRGWVTADLAALLERRPETADRTRALPRPEIEALWQRRDVPLREKTLWRLLYESAARADSVLSLDIEDLDLPGKRARVTAKGGVIRWVQWQSRTARLLPRLIGGRTCGPLFLAPSASRPGPHPGIGRHLPAHRPGPTVLPARRVPVQAGHRRSNAAPAAALPADPPRRGRLVRLHAHGPVRPREPPHPRHLRQSQR
jgi:integrase